MYRIAKCRRLLRSQNVKPLPSLAVRNLPTEVSSLHCVAGDSVDSRLDITLTRRATGTPIVYGNAKMQNTMFTHPATVTQLTGNSSASEKRSNTLRAASVRMVEIASSTTGFSSLNTTSQLLRRNWFMASPARQQQGPSSFSSSPRRSTSLDGFPL